MYIILNLTGLKINNGRNYSKENLITTITFNMGNVYEVFKFYVINYRMNKKYGYKNLYFFIQLRLFCRIFLDASLFLGTQIAFTWILKITNGLPEDVW